MKFSSQNLALVSLLMVAATPVSLADLGFGDGQNDDPTHSQPGPSVPGYPDDTENQGMISRQIDLYVDGEMDLSLAEALGMDLGAQDVQSVLIRAHGVGSEGLIIVRSGERREARMVAGWSEEHEFQLAPQDGSCDLNEVLLQLRGRFVVESIAVKLRGYDNDRDSGDDRGGGGYGRGDNRDHRHDRDHRGRRGDRGRGHRDGSR